MTNESEKDFDAVQHMRELRDRISRDIEGMTYEEEKAYIQERLKRARALEPELIPEHAV
jgi:type II secretory pathway predicted ATPase ExeA